MLIYNVQSIFTLLLLRLPYGAQLREMLSSSLLSFLLSSLLAALGGRRLPLGLAEGLAGQFVLLLGLCLSAAAAALSVLLRLALRIALVLANLFPLELVGADLFSRNTILNPLVLSVIKVLGIGVSQHVVIVL